MKTKPCIIPGCPYQGYVDTQKCWPHSRGEELPPDAGRNVTHDDSSPMTFVEQCAIDASDELGTA